MQEIDLLRGINIRKRLRMQPPARLVYRCKARAIHRPQTLQRPAQLPVDVVDDTGPRRSGIPVYGNNLLADCRQRSGLFHRQESPRRSIAPATQTGRCRRCNCGLQKDTPVESRSLGHACFVRRNQTILSDASHLRLRRKTELPSDSAPRATITGFKKGRPILKWPRSLVPPGSMTSA